MNPAGLLSLGVLALSLSIAPTNTARADEPLETKADPASPRAAVGSYLELARQGKNDEAAAYLQIPSGAEAHAPVLAERLRFVLERHHGAELDELSPEADGDPDDGLPKGVDRVAVVTDESGNEEDVLIKRVETRTGKRWLFARQSVRRVDPWFYALSEHRWLEVLPEPLRRSGPLYLLWWQWGAFLILIVAGWIAGMLLGKLTVRALKEITKRTPPDWDDEIVARKRGPLTLLWAAITCWAFLPLLDLYPAADSTLKSVLKITVYVALFWAFTRAADVVAANAARREWARRNPASRALIRLAARLLKVLVLGVGIVGLLAQLGFPVASLVAGLGAGGLAFALAAQRTVGNLFGAFSLAVDQPLREGDLVRVGEQLGTVEAIGLWTTRIRAPDRTLISIPNGVLAETKIESLALRDRTLLECKIGLVYETSAEQLHQILRELESVLRAHEKIWPNTVNVHLAAFGDSSLDIEVAAWFKTTSQEEFLEIRQEILLGFMNAIEDAGSAFAFPTQTLHVATPQPKN